MKASFGRVGRLTEIDEIGFWVGIRALVGCACGDDARGGILSSRIHQPY
jgi:hypothetical protein